MTMERNAPCYCGSGRKYKKCCLAKDEADAAMRVAEAKQQAAAEVEEKRRAREEELAARRQARESATFGTSNDEYDDDEVPAATTPGPPPLPEEDQQLVDAWWEEVSPVYMSNDALERADWLLERTVAFLDEHPRLFPHLDLQDEFLLDVGSTLNRAGLMAGHHALLLRLRDEQPEVYAECFGFFDSELLAEALRDGRRNDIPACLALFRQDPIRFIDQLADVVDLLAWQDCESELRGLLEATARTIYKSDKVINGGFGMRWLVNLEIFPTLELGDTSADSLEELCDRVMAVGYLKDDPENREWLRHGALMAMPTAIEAALDLDQAHSDSFNGDVGWSFAGWLRRTKGLAWSSSRLLAESMLEYWSWIDRGHKRGTAAGKKGRKGGAKATSPGTFGLDGDRLRTYLNEYCQDFFGIRAVTVVPTLQAFHYFTEYLLARGRLDGARAAELQGFAARDFEVIRKQVGADSAPYRIYPTFAALIGGSDQSPFRGASIG